MKRTKNRKPLLAQNEMLPEYDFGAMKGVRGKYYQAMRRGYTITIRGKDGTTIVKEVKPKGTILLEPDVQKYFPNSKTVNAALRSMISPVPLKLTKKIRETAGAYGLRRVAKPKQSNHKSPHTLPHK